jgi:hypothetical protein
MLIHFRGRVRDKKNDTKLSVARVAQSVERLTCNEDVAGSTPVSGSTWVGFPSGQREQTVNLSAKPSEVRILPPPPSFTRVYVGDFGLLTNII